MLEFDAPSHTYRYRGAVVPHVTQICGFLGGYAGIPSSVLEAARERGEAVHYATELYDRGQLDEASVPPEVAGYLDAWKLFRAQTGFTPRAIEERVRDHAFGFAGTLDRTGFFANLKKMPPNKECLIDIKATYTVLPQVRVQTALYAHAYSGGAPGSHLMPRFAVQLRADGDYRLHRFTDRSDLSVGLAALTLHSWKQRHATNTDIDH